MSSSEHDNMSESSNLDPASNESTFSPYSGTSPSQIVPELANGIIELTCEDAIRENKPYLRIIEEPVDYFRFRYRSEMLGTHGCLLGRNSAQVKKSKSHPTVELCNYNGSALIRCSLARHNSSLEHPHKLTEEDQDRDITSLLPLRGSYKVAFSGLGIIHTAKKDIPTLLYKRYSQELKQNEFNERKLRMQCENETKNINLNIVRLMFTAHDVTTGAPICPPVFSQSINNLKSAATNDLKICRANRYYGRPNGGDTVYILVEKVNKKNIAIRFYELDEIGDKVWEDRGHFLQSDVHHQYAIVFTTPPYRDTKTKTDVKVFFELLRPSDGRCSEPKEFTYIADVYNRDVKKRKAESYSSLGSSGGSVKSFSDLPLTLDFANTLTKKEMDIDPMPILPPNNYIPPTPPSNSDLMGDALLQNVSSHTNTSHYISPMLSQPNVPAPPIIQLDSTEMNRLLEPNPHIPSEERRRFLDSDLSEYFRTFDENLSSETNLMSFVKNSVLVGDSARVRDVCRKPEEKVIKDIKEESPVKLHEDIRVKTEYSAVYTPEDGLEVKTLVKELCDIIRSERDGKRQIVQDKLKKLFSIRLINGDTFLHMTLCSNQPSLHFIVKLIHDMGMSSLLNIQNNRLRTVLHMAIINDQFDLIPFLLSKGCNPMLDDDEGNNAIHYAVIRGSCLEPLLKGIKDKEDYDIDACNFDKHTALHLSATYSNETYTKLLVDFGASCLVRDSEGRTPLHLAVSNNCMPVVKCLLSRMSPSDIDATDGRDYTALQLACDGPLRPHTLSIAKLLLDKADPTNCDQNSKVAFKMASDKPELMKLLHQYAIFADEVIKSEPEDDYESADEECTTELSELSSYIREVSAILDRSEGWRELAKRLHRDSLLRWYEATPSPTTTLLNHIKELNDGVTSQSLIILLHNIGETEAANIIKERLL